MTPFSHQTLVESLVGNPSRKFYDMFSILNYFFIIHHPLSIIYYALSIIHYPLTSSAIHYPLFIILYPSIMNFLFPVAYFSLNIIHSPSFIMPVIFLEVCQGAKYAS